MSAEYFRNRFAEEKLNKRYLDPTLEDPEIPENVVMDTLMEIKKPESIVKYKVIEDWIFDKKESRMYVRIIAIAPLVKRTVNGEEVEDEAWCWLKYHKDVSDADLVDVRGILVNMVI